MLVLRSFVVVVTLVTEKVLAYINHSQKMVLFTERRYINLREYQPFLDVVDIPPAKAVRELLRPGSRRPTGSLPMPMASSCLITNIPGPI